MGIKNDNLIFENRISKLLNVNELCEVTGFKRGTIYNWVHREVGFPYVKWGKAIRFNLDEVISWLENRS